MFLDIDLNFDTSSRAYYPGEVINVELLIDASLKLYCREIKVVFKCPYNTKTKKKTNMEYFKLQKAAVFQSTGKVAEKFKFKKGLNKFNVSCTVPHLSDNVFKSKNNIQVFYMHIKSMTFFCLSS